MKINEDLKNRIQDLKMPVKQKIEWVESVLNLYLKIHPEYKFKPFVKNFNSWHEYHQWQKKQKNPLFW